MTNDESRLRPSVAKGLPQASKATTGKMTIMTNDDNDDNYA